MLQLILHLSLKTGHQAVAGPISMVAQQPCPATLSLTVWNFLICVLFWYQVCAHSTGERKGTGGQERDSLK